MIENEKKSRCNYGTRIKGKWEEGKQGRENSVGGVNGVRWNKERGSNGKKGTWGGKNSGSREK